ncbi:MAG: 50S ribosomal protein L13 [Phycisphaeraceae bacterium]|nr:50S ribosomal protein L13 [Phycisphaeraceae bacterium]
MGGIASPRRQTYIAKQSDVKRSWHVVDAAGIPLGRLAVEVANVLMGKHRPTYTPHVDCGDYVVVTNAAHVGLTGKKADQRLKMRYTSHPGGLKTQTYGQVRERRPELLIRDAVRRMMPKNRLARVMLKKLHVVDGADNPYASHKPQTLQVPLP